MVIMKNEVFAKLYGDFHIGVLQDLPRQNVEFAVWFQLEISYGATFQAVEGIYRKFSERASVVREANNRVVRRTILASTRRKDVSVGVAGHLFDATENNQVFQVTLECGFLCDGQLKVQRRCDGD